MPVLQSSNAPESASHQVRQRGLGKSIHAAENRGRFVNDCIMANNNNLALRVESEKAWRNMPPKYHAQPFGLRVKKGLGQPIHSKPAVLAGLGPLNYLEQDA